jgi:hypothetical protein
MEGTKMKSKSEYREMIYAGVTKSLPDVELDRVITKIANDMREDCIKVLKDYYPDLTYIPADMKAIKFAKERREG